MKLTRVLAIAAATLLVAPSALVAHAHVDPDEDLTPASARSYSFANAQDSGPTQRATVGNVNPAEQKPAQPTKIPTTAPVPASTAPVPTSTAPTSTAPGPAPGPTPSSSASSRPPTPSSRPTPAPGPSDNNGTTGGDFLKPFGTDAPSETLFKRNDGLAKIAPIINVNTELLKTRAIPTNKWWGNLIHTTVKDNGVVANPAWSNPYALKLPVAKGPFGLQACYSYTYRRKADPKGDKIKFYLHEFKNDFTLSAAEFTAAPKYEVYDWSDFGANLRICSGAKCMDSAVVNGMSFISATYNGLTPKLVTEAKITKFEQGKGKYVIQLGNKQTWVMYTSGDGVKFTSDETSVSASGPYTGTIRIAVLPEGASPDAYDAYAGCIVQGGKISIESRTQYSFNWQVNGTTCAEGGLLHFAFQHHLDSMGDAGLGANNITLQSTVRGSMSGVVTKSAAAGSAAWKLQEPELKEKIGFYSPRPIAADVVKQLQLKEKLQEDIDAEWKIDGASYYFSGKAFQKYASLCLLADEPTIAGEDKTLLQTCLKKLETVLEKFVSNSFPSPLAYDTTYRGIVTSEVFKKGDINADFGNGIYNDHHYHYGYWIMGSAILRKLDPKWERMAELEATIWTLLRDVANPSPADEYFPTFRHFSWFLGHSYSHGASPLADGKDQESTSEDINFHYGMMLWGQVTGNKAVEDLGSLMLRVDARAVRTYFLMDSDNKLHPPEFAKNHVTGIFFDNKVDYATWFSAEKYCIHGIQMIPVSPINEIVRSPKFIQEEWEDVLSKESIVVGKDLTNAWNSLLYANYATINKKEALSVLDKVKMDDGLTRSWALYVAATRPDASK